MNFLPVLISVLAAGGGVYRVQATAPLALTLPAAPEEDGHWVRAAGGKWVRVKAQAQDGSLTFHLDPAQWAGGETVLVVSKPKGVDLSDATAPKVTQLAVDGKAVADAPVVDLGWRTAAPAQIAWQIEDAGRLDLAGLSISANGAPLVPGKTGLTLTPSADGRKATIRLVPAQVPGIAAQAEARIALSVADSAPNRNTLERAAVYHLLLPPPAGKTVEARTDSCFANYTADPLIDGKPMEPGSGSTVGVTWASEEASTPHWVLLAYDKPRKVEGVEIFWTPYQDQFTTSARYAVEYWDGGAWKPLAEEKAGKPARSSEHRFPAVTTSALRILQPAGGGSKARPDLMWLSEVRVF